jgi:hypothetical protein
MKNTHTHHIIPKHMGGTNDPSNLVELTVRQHALAHKKLYKKYGKWQDKMAYESLLKLKPRHEITKEIQRQTGIMSRGRKLSKQARLNISNGMKGLKKGEEQKKKTANTLAQEWIVTDPKGMIHNIKNLYTFCKQKKLCPGNMSRVAKGIFEQHKGYKVSYK